MSSAGRIDGAGAGGFRPAVGGPERAKKMPLDDLGGLKPLIAVAGGIIALAAGVFVMLTKESHKPYEVVERGALYDDEGEFTLSSKIEKDAIEDGRDIDDKVFEGEDDEVMISSLWLSDENRVDGITIGDKRYSKTEVNEDRDTYKRDLLTLCRERFPGDDVSAKKRFTDITHMIHQGNLSQFCFTRFTKMMSPDDERIPEEKDMPTMLFLQKNPSFWSKFSIEKLTPLGGGFNIEIKNADEGIRVRLFKKLDFKEIPVVRDAGGGPPYVYGAPKETSLSIDCEVIYDVDANTARYIVSSG
jgi:hypothetical protein